MKHILFYTLGSIILIMVAFTISHAQVLQQPQQAQMQQLKKGTPTTSQPQQGQIQQPQLQVGTQGSYQATKASMVGEPGPYYAPPSWDQTLTCTTTNCPRFLVLSNMGSNAVLDRETGLVWEKSPSVKNVNWYDGQFYCYNLTLGDRKGWRIPMEQELMSLVDPTRSNPALPAGHPFSNVLPSLYWSAATIAVDAKSAWGVFFFNGNVGVGDKSNRNFVWCVRGGQGVDAR